MIIHGRSSAVPQPNKEQADLKTEDVVKLLRENFPNELNELFKLRPLRDLANDDDFINAFGKIIYRNRSLAHSETKRAILRSVQSADEAVEKIEVVKKGVEGLSVEQFELIVNVANQLFPAPFPEAVRPFHLADMLRQFQMTLLLLSAALTLGTGLFQGPRRQGRPTSEHVLTTIELIQLWEHVTAEKSLESLQDRRIKPVPTPKKDKGIISQPSTEFVRIGLQMISPGITDSQVFTAIKNALQLQREFYKFLPTEADVAKAMGAIFRMNERANLV